MEALLKNAQGSVEASLIHVWEHDNLPDKTSCAESFRNMALSLFDTIPQATRVALLWTGQNLLFLVKVQDGRYFDASAEEVMVEWRGKDA